MELHSRLIPNAMNVIRECVKLHGDEKVDLDDKLWKQIDNLRRYLGQDTTKTKSLMTRIKLALENHDFHEASEMQKEMQEKERELIRLYSEYKKNIL